MRIGKKLILGFVGVALLIGVVGIVGYSYMSEVNKKVTKIVTGHFPEAEACLEMMIDFRKQNENLYSYLLGNKRAREEFAENGEEYKVWNEILTEKQGNPEHIKMREKAEIFHSKFEKEVKEIWKMYDDGNVQDAMTKAEEISSFLKESTSILRELKDAEVVGTKSKGEAVTKLVGRAVLVFVAIFGISLISALIIGIFVSRSITKPISKLKDAAIDIAQGNMDAKIDVKPGDEIGELAEAFDNMRTSLKVVMEEYEKREKTE